MRYYIRLTLDLAHRIATQVASQVLFVPLSAGTSSPQIFMAIFNVMGLMPPLSNLQTHLVALLSQQPTLFVLDNFEQLLQAMPKLSLLVTSREPLGLYAEHVYALAGLTIGPAVG